jgi:TolB-like protein/tetratricopeptide (TPR) repeat protein
MSSYGPGRNHVSGVSFIENLKQRKIVQWVLAYLAAAWLVMQLVDVLGSRWGVSESAARIVDLLLLLGLIVTMVIAWYHGEQGRQRISGIELLIVTALLGLGALGLTLIGQSPEPMESDTATQASNALPPRDIASAPWVAVLPFRVQGTDQELADIAMGLTSDITAGLSRFSYLLVISQVTTEAALSETSDVRQLGTKLGARYVMEGNLRGADQGLRLTAQLTDTRDGTTIWSESFDHRLDERGMFALQDEITDRVVATVADVNGAIIRTLASAISNKSPETMTPYEALLQWALSRQSVGAEDHLRSRIALQRAVEAQPAYADAWACLAHTYLQEYISAYNVLPDSMERAYAAAQRAVGLDPTSALAQYTLALVYYFRQDLPAFRVATEKAIALNPRDTETLAMLGIVMGYGGDWEQSLALTTRAMQLNPNHPGWYWFNAFMNEYRQGHYEAALEIALRINMPEYWGDGLARTVVYGQLGDLEAAQVAVDELLLVWPEFESEYVDKGLKNWMFNQPELVEQVIDGLQKAGLELSWEGKE